MIPILETERLRLRAPKLDDLPAEAEFYADPERSHFVGGPSDEAGVWNMIAMMLGHWHLRGYGFWAVEDRADHTYYGRVGLWFPHGWPEPEIGWVMTAAGEGRSIAYEAAIAARNFAYGKLGWSTLISFITPDNTRSAALAERLGCTFEKAVSDPVHNVRFIWRHPGPEAL